MTDNGYLHHRSESWGKVPIELIHDPTVTDGAVRLFAHMHWRYGSDCKNFEGRTSMAEMLQVSETTVSNRIAELVQHDWVIAVERNTRYGRKSNFYHVFESQADCIAWRTAHKLAKPAPRTDKTGKPIVRKGRQGIGGQPSHKDDTTKSTQVDNEPKSTQVDMNQNQSRLTASIYPDPAFDPESDSSQRANAVAAQSNLPGIQVVEGTQPPSEVLEPSPPVAPAPPKKSKGERQPWTALTDAMHEAIPDAIRPPGKPHYGKNNAGAKACYDAGITANEVTAFVQDAYLYDPYIQGKKPGQAVPVVMYMSYVQENFKAWKVRQHDARVSTSTGDVPRREDRPDETPDPGPAVNPFRNAIITPVSVR